MNYSEVLNNGVLSLLFLPLHNCTTQAAPKVRVYFCVLRFDQRFRLAPKDLDQKDGEFAGAALRGLSGYQRDGEHPEEQHESHLKFTRCSHDKANYMRITSPEDSPDTTGVHVVSSRNVHIMDDSISTCTLFNF